MVVKVCIVIYLAAVLSELLLHGKWVRFALELTVVVILSAIALLNVNAAAGHVAFGEGASSLWTVGIMFGATILGVASRYLFQTRKQEFSWLDFIKPIAVSPIVLYPLIGTLQAAGTLNEMQVVSFALLAFQNGFFWQAVLQAAKPKR